MGPEGFSRRCQEEQDKEKDKRDLQEEQTVFEKGNLLVLHKEKGARCRIQGTSGGVHENHPGSGVVAGMMVHLIRFYQRFISPYLPGQCRFYPTCSEYSLQAFRKYGFFKGAFLSTKRILKCNPFHPGGYDPLR